MSYIKVTPATMINAVLAADRGARELLAEEGMNCFACPSAIGESLEEACFVHGYDTDEIVAKLNAFFEKKYPEKK